MYSPCMPNVQVRNIPDEVHGVLVHRAWQAGQSLQQSASALWSAGLARPGACLGLKLLCDAHASNSVPSTLKWSLEQ